MCAYVKLIKLSLHLGKTSGRTSYLIDGNRLIPSCLPCWRYICEYNGKNVDMTLYHFLHFKSLLITM